MDLTDGEEHRAFRVQVRVFIEQNRHLAPKTAAQSYRLRPRPYERDTLRWQKLLVEHGYACRTVPAEYGGFGAEEDILKTAIISEEFFAADLPQGLNSQGISMLVPTILEHGTEAQKSAWIEKTILGEVFWCQGYSEPDAGSDLTSLKTAAVEDGDDFVINGQKIWTSSAHIAQMMFCLVRTEADAPRHAGISYMIFPVDLPGIEIRPLQTMTGHPSFNEVFLTDVRVPKTALVGDRGQGWVVANSTLKHERGMLGAAHGLAWRLSRLRDLIARQKAAGSLAMPIEVLRDRYAGLQARVEGLRLHEMRLVSMAAENQPAGTGALVCKLLGCELNHQLDILAMDLRGPESAAYNPDAELASDEIWHQLSMYDLGLIIGGGTAQIQKNIIAKRGLGMPREARRN
ncbi:acyl-CoA dehydrogenase family protein [uncultured Sulfitobacter sp.]|uniref:acyl-CoA dehydrogenase family protein n=1 Tax=uncultured Sulfitobacter sp. TaxID=191468 RepID=UPI00262DCA76|nr:acyl-CoA dehydrogenase family protein [uncultured Sulfitobacter sp.]